MAEKVIAFPRLEELPPVNYLIQKTKRSRPFIAHVDKLKPFSTDNPPKSWLTDVEPVGGNGDHGGIVAGDVASGMVDSRDDSDGVVVPHTDNSGHSDGVIEIAVQ